MQLGNANLWRFFCGCMFCMLFTQWTTFSFSKLVSELHKKSHVTLDCEEDKISFSHCLRIVPPRECWIFRRDRSTETGRSWISPMLPEGHKMKKYLGLCGIHSHSLHLSPFSLLHSSFATLPSIHATILMYNSELIDSDIDSKYQSTERQANTVCVCACVRGLVCAEGIACVACTCPFRKDKG
jgi:hypothetical protein